MIYRFLCWLFGHRPYKREPGGAHLVAKCFRCKTWYKIPDV